MADELNFNPSNLNTYLESARWVRERSDSRRTIWRHESGRTVFVPGREGPDVQPLLAVALGQITAVEGRPEDDVVIDLTWPTFDRLRVRKESPGSAVSITEAIALHETVNDVIVAGVRASTDRRRSFSGRPPTVVAEYLDRVRILPSAPGSFIVRALLPLTRPTSAQDTLPLFGPEAATLHAASRSIMEASRAAVQTATEVATGAPLTEWDNVIPEGVSANLCDALSRLPGETPEGAADVELSVGWTWAEPYDAANLIRVPTGLTPVLAAARDFLRDVPDEYEIRMIGLITKLHRDTAAGPGEITVRGHIENFDSGARSLKAGLDETTYRDAIRAHEDGNSVSIRAFVRRGTRGFEVIRVLGFDVVAATPPA